MADEAATLLHEPAADEQQSAAPVKAPDLKAAPDAPKAGKGKGEKPAKDKKGKKERAEIESGAGDGPSVAAHPRAARGVARAKAWGALIGFTIGGYFSLPTATLADAGLRALLAGIVCYMFAWGASVFAWRRVVMIEITAREHQLITVMQAAQSAPEPGGGERARAA